MKVRTVQLPMYMNKGIIKGTRWRERCFICTEYAPRRNYPTLSSIASSFTPTPHIILSALINNFTILTHEQLHDTNTQQQHNKTGQILNQLAISKDSSFNTYEFASNLPPDYGVSHENIVGTSKSLAGDGYVIMKSSKIDYWELTDEGRTVLREGSQEAKCFKAIKASGEGGLDRKDLEEAVGKDAAKVGMGNCMKNKWIAKEGDKMKAKATDIEDIVQIQLSKLSGCANPEDNGAVLPGKDASLLKKRKLVVGKSRTSYDVTRGPEYAEERVKKAADLTKEMIDSGAWETTKVRRGEGARRDQVW